MNKAIYLCAAAALALASCSNDETVEVAGQTGISFRAVAGLNSRAVETTTANLANMFVTAYENGAANAYYSNVEYTRENNTNTFVSNPEYFWLKGKTINFLALSPAATDWTATNNVTFDSNANTYSATFTDVTPNADIANQKDLLIGKASGADNGDGKGLDLTLNHVLSQIQIQAKNTNAAYVYSIKGIRIASVAAKGTYTFTDAAGTWAAGADKQTYDVILDTPITLDGTKADAQNLMKQVNSVSDNAMLIPQQLVAWNGNAVTDAAAFDNGAYISLLLNVKSNNGSYIYPAKATADTDCGWAAVAINTNWEAGKKYIYTLDLSKGCGKVDPVNPNENGKDIVKPGTEDPGKGEKIFGEPIKFDVTVADWTDTANDIELQ